VAEQAAQEAARRKAAAEQAAQEDARRKTAQQPPNPIIARLETPSTPKAPEAVSDHAIAWERVKDSSDARAIQAFITKFPNSALIPAKKRLADIQPSNQKPADLTGP
jgi:hypothetical protein